MLLSQAYINFRDHETAVQCLGLGIAQPVMLESGVPQHAFKARCREQSWAYRTSHKRIIMLKRTGR